MRAILVVTLAVLGALAMSVAGCNCGLRPAARPGPDGGVADAGLVACHVDDDCPLGQQCSNDACVDATVGAGDTGCKTDADCGAGTLCADSTGKCVDAAATPGVPGGPPGVCNDGDRRTCGSKVGVCDYGVNLCVSGQWSPDCLGATGPSAEKCDGLDNDCNGVVDDGPNFPNLGGPCSDGLGVCQQAGVIVCTADGSGVECSAKASSPSSPELCGNGLDDNCDGQTDEGFANLGAACSLPSTCGNIAGTLQCSADKLSLECVAAGGGSEICDGIDNNNNGCIDEGFDVGVACSVGVGACQRLGTKVCSADHLSTVCNATPGTPALAESCNNIDDNCDGRVDEGCDDDGDGFCDATLAFGTPPIAACPNSTSAALLDCNDNNAAIHPGATESCTDHVDNNCDGKVDCSDPTCTGNAACAACDPLIDADHDGFNQCQDCDDHNGAVHPGAVELCNGIDDNCNGTIDEGFDKDADGFTTCGTKPGGGLSAALADCNDNDATVHPDGSAFGLPSACERCLLNGTAVCNGAPNSGGNGKDDNCNGLVDEGCGACDPIDHDGDGFSQCQGDCNDADVTVHPGAPEICDCKDNDCNKNTVENCGVSGKCNCADPTTDQCESGLICVESLTSAGHTSGNFSCTSFCNITAPGLGLRDSCAANQTCAAALTPTDNLHGCAVNATIGTLAPGASCSGDGDCRSGDCQTDPRLTGHHQVCVDFCGDDGYCPSGTSCQILAPTLQSAQCFNVLSTQTLAADATCTAATAPECRNGGGACIDSTSGGSCKSTSTSCKCRKPCCKNADCAGGEFCSLKGNAAAGPNGGEDTVPVCFPQTAGNRGFVGGSACSASTDCASQFCDVNLGTCVDLCCNDTQCPSGFLCNSELVTLGPATGQQTFARICEATSPAQPLVAR